MIQGLRGLGARPCFWRACRALRPRGDSRCERCASAARRQP
jgi:hypothetical protein